MQNDIILYNGQIVLLNPFIQEARLQFSPKYDKTPTKVVVFESTDVRLAWLRDDIMPYSVVQLQN